MRQTIEATALALAVCASLATGFSRGEALSGNANRELPAASPAVAGTVTGTDAQAASAEVTSRQLNVEATSSWELPNLENQRVDYWISRYTTDLRSSFATFLDRMTKYEPMITAKLDQRDMPKELLFLPLVESGFNPAAKSPAQAKGLWQFMAATAQRYGLTVRGHVDERTNPAKSTEAALSYLSDLYDRFGSWYLAAAAYNTGEGRIARVMKQVTGSENGSDTDYYAIASKLPQETRDYVPKLIAAARIASEPQKYGFEGDNL